MNVGVWAVLACAALGADPKANDGYDWPQWRGPNRDAVCRETGLLQKWPEDGPPVAWVADNLGGGYSTPSIADGRVFGMGYIGDREAVWAVDAKTGKKLWTTPFADKGRRVGYDDGPRSTPTVDGDRLYALGLRGTLVCTTVKDGKVLWKVDFLKEFGAKIPTWGFAESALVDGDHVVVTPGGEKAVMVKLDKTTGKVVWKCPGASVAGAAYCSIRKTKVGNTELYINFTRKALVGVAAEDGKLLWSYRKTANRVANIATPVISGNYVFSSTAYKQGTSLIEMMPAEDGGVEVKEVYFIDYRKVCNHHGGMILKDGYIYLGHQQNGGRPRCVELKTGKQVWEEERGPGRGSAALLYADNRLYFRYQRGTMALLEASPDGPEVISSFKLPYQSGKASWPHPVISHGRMYIRDQDKMVCFDVKKK